MELWDSLNVLEMNLKWDYGEIPSQGPQAKDLSRVEYVQNLRFTWIDVITKDKWVFSIVMLV